MASVFATVRSAPDVLGAETALLQAVAATAGRLLSPLEVPPESPWPLMMVMVLVWALLDTVAALVFAATSPFYRALPVAQKRVWSNRVVSMLHALVVAIGATRVIALDRALGQPYAYTFSPPAAVYLAAFAGYTLYDFVVITRRHFNPAAVAPGAALFAHHVVAFAMTAMQMYICGFALGATCLLVNEWSTPLLHVRYFLSDLHVPKTHWLVHANQVAFALTFFVCRVLLNCWVAARTIYAFFMDPHEAYVLTGARFVPVSASVLLVAFAAINIHWFVLIVAKARERPPHPPEVKPEVKPVVKPKTN